MSRLVMRVAVDISDGIAGTLVELRCLSQPPSLAVAVGYAVQIEALPVSSRRQAAL